MKFTPKSNLIIIIAVFVLMNLFSQTLLSQTEKSAGLAQVFADTFKRDFKTYSLRAKKISESLPSELVKKISTDELICIYSYTVDLSQSVNKMLRDGSGNANLKLFVNTMSSGLKKIEPYSGIVVRGTRLPEKVAKMYKKDSVVSDPAFLSASVDQGYTGTHVFFIRSKTARPIAHLSAVPEDKEVIFLPNTRFKVTNVVAEKGAQHIEMEEL